MVIRYPVSNQWIEDRSLPSDIRYPPLLLGPKQQIQTSLFSPMDFPGKPLQRFPEFALQASLSTKAGVLPCGVRARPALAIQVLIFLVWLHFALQAAHLQPFEKVSTFS